MSVVRPLRTGGVKDDSLCVRCDTTRADEVECTLRVRLNRSAGSGSRVFVLYPQPADTTAEHGAQTLWPLSGAPSARECGPSGAALGWIPVVPSQRTRREPRNGPATAPSTTFQRVACPHARELAMHMVPRIRAGCIAAAQARAAHVGCSCLWTSDTRTKRSTRTCLRNYP